MKVKDEELGVIISRSWNSFNLRSFVRFFEKESIDNVLKNVLVYKTLRRSQKVEISNKKGIDNEM